MNFYNDNKSLKFYLSHPVMDKIIKLKERDFADSDNDMMAPTDVEDAIDNYDKVLEIVGDLAANVLEANAEERDVLGLISITISLSVLGSCAHCTFVPPITSTELTIL